ncbi:protein rhomboid-like [Amphibalanus amphitrite]|uniref:protein rhomboid-like n=1 Tax=Amphibalanus amphitrite TaxID=1232801 RepID=UPI001C9230DB|nr:protein rhomboid-like [Amphibalanus amphitrite]
MGEGGRARIDSELSEGTCRGDKGLLNTACKSVVPRSRRPPTYLRQYDCRPPPIVIPLLSTIQLVLFIYDGVRLGGITASGPVDPESPLIYSPYRRREVWRLLTYMLVHVGWVHIVYNLIVQLLVGLPLELVHKWWRVGIVYLCGVLAGSLATSVLDPRVFLAGASGGVYALLTAHLADLVLNWAEMEFAFVRLGILLLLAGTDVGVAIYNRYGTETGNKVAYTAHLAGALAGLLMGHVALRNLRLLRWERVLWWVSLVTYLLLVLVMVVFNAAAPEGYFPPQDV